MSTKLLLATGTIALLTLATPSSAIVFGGTNFRPLAGYPDPECEAPMRPYSRDEYELARYRSDFNSYIECMQTYLDNANNDIKRIREKMDTAIQTAKDEARRP